ncbi:MAG: hypothetical protein IJT28_07755 [Bacteroidaceae bacterium]|nr:hypothetical protein [Bacteroidaceae bacterium]
MKQKALLVIAAMMAATFSFTACSDDKDDNNNENELQAKETFLAATNQELVNKTILPIYTNLMNANEQLVDAIGEMETQADVNKACELWKKARQYWEQSESFLYGPATDFGIDPHTDTWPFDRAAFDNYIKRYPDLVEDEDAQAIVAEAIATGQSLTGFHAVEYLLFREGQPRNIDDITDNEAWFCLAAAEDLYLASVKLVSAWGGKLNEEQEEILEDAEFESRNYGENFINAGKAGSTYSTITLASVQILEGCQDIIDEVAHSKIGHPYTGEDKNYIESPHAYNSIQDFYDNVLSCAFSINGGADKKDAYTATSLMAYAMAHYPTEAAAVKGAFEEALKKVDGMKRPFVLNYQDASAGAAIDALETLDDAIDALKVKLQK